MGWERRQRGGRYYVQKERQGGKVVSRYIGSGETADLISRMNALERQQSETQRDEVRTRRERLATLDAEMQTYYDDVEAILRATMEQAGYHRHHRGEWRKRRHVGNSE